MTTIVVGSSKMTKFSALGKEILIYFLLIYFSFFISSRKQRVKKKSKKKKSRSSSKAFFLLIIFSNTVFSRNMPRSVTHVKTAKEQGLFRANLGVCISLHDHGCVFLIFHIRSGRCFEGWSSTFVPRHAPPSLQLQQRATSPQEAWACRQKTSQCLLWATRIYLEKSSSGKRVMGLRTPWSLAPCRCRSRSATNHP